MKIGSIVEFIGLCGLNINLECDIIPYKNKPYTVRDIEIIGGHPFIRLEEFICNCSEFSDVPINIKCFREIQFPDDLMEQVEECLTRELIETI